MPLQNATFRILNLLTSILIKLDNALYNFQCTGGRHAPSQALPQFADIIDWQDFYSSLYSDYYYLGLCDWMLLQCKDDYWALQSFDKWLQVPSGSPPSLHGRAVQAFCRLQFCFPQEGRLLLRGIHPQNDFPITQVFWSVPSNNNNKNLLLLPC